MARILGLDLGSHTAKALVLEVSFRNTSVKGFRTAPVEGEDRAMALRSALKLLAADRGLVADQVAVSVPGAAAAAQMLTLPFKAEKQVELTLPGEVEGKMLFDLDEIIYDYQPLAASGEKTDLLVGAIQIAEMESLLELLREVGVDPRVVTLPAIAYTPLLATGLGAPEAVHAIVDLGHQRVSVAIGTALGGCELARTFNGGGEGLTKVLAADFQVPVPEAESWKIQHGDVSARDRTGDEEAAYNALVRGLAPLIRELRQTFRSNQARFRRPVTQVHLCGGTARLRGLPEYLARELGVPVQLLSAPTAMGEAVKPADIPLAAQAYALAERANQGTGGRTARFNLRRGIFGFKGDFEYLKGKVGRLGAFAGVLLVLAGANSYARIELLTNREKQLDDKLCETTQKVLGKCQRDFTVALSMLRGSNAPTAVIPAVSAVELLAETSSHIPEDSHAKLSEAEISLNRLRLRGTVDSFDSVDKLSAGLKGYKCFTDVKRGKVEKNRKDPTLIDFTLDIEVGCAEPGAGQG